MMLVKPSPRPHDFRETAHRCRWCAWPSRWFVPKRKFPRRLSYLNRPGAAAEKERRKPFAPWPITTCPLQRLFLAFCVPATLLREGGEAATQAGGVYGSEGCLLAAEKVLRDSRFCPTPPSRRTVPGTWRPQLLLLSVSPTWASWSAWPFHATSVLDVGLPDTANKNTGRSVKSSLSEIQIQLSILYLVWQSYLKGVSGNFLLGDSFRCFDVSLLPPHPSCGFASEVPGVDTAFGSLFWRCP